jgi:rhodanese-related sulfurtransferase
MRNYFSKTSKRYLLIAAIITAVYSVSGCKEKAGSTESIAISMGQFISAYDADINVQVLDVRTPGEYAEGRVPGAKLVPLNEVEAGSAIPFEKESKIYVICRSGKRSYQATQYLRSHGFNNAVSVDGGTMAWISTGKPVER